MLLRDMLYTILTLWSQLQNTMYNFGAEYLVIPY